MKDGGRRALRIGSWIAVAPLLFATAVCLIRYAAWTAVVSGYSSLPNQHAIVSHAQRMANLWLSLLLTAEIIATVLLFLLLPGRLRLLRLVIPVLAVPVVAGAIAYLLVVLGHLR